MPRPSLHLVRSRTKVAPGRVYEYAYLRYEVWDERKGRLQPVPVASLGRTDRLDEERVDSLAQFLRDWLRKDSALPFEALQARFETAVPAFRILCSRGFGMRLLIEQAWRELGYADAVAEILEDSDKADRLERAIFAMIVVQLITPQSKRGMSTWAGTEAGSEVFFPEAQGLELNDLYRAMDHLEAGYGKVELKLSEKLRELGLAPTELAQDTSTVTCRIRYDDVERAAIEEERQARGEAVRDAVVNDPPLRMRGESKDKRNDLPQVVLEAILGDNGIIVHHATHAGNASDKNLVGPSAKALEQLGYKQVLWTFDSGFNSAKNRDALRAADFELVSSEGMARTAVVKRVLATAGRYSPHPTKPEVSFKCVVETATEESPARERLYIVRWNRFEEEFQLRTIERHLDKAKKALAAGGAKADDLLSHPTYKKYVRRDARTKDADGNPAGPVLVDREAVEHMKLLAGKSVIATDALDAHPLFADDLYRLTAELERVFRVLKSTIRVRPVRHRSAHRIRAHVMLAVMAHNIGAWLALKSGLTLEALQRLFANLRVQQVQAGSATYWERTELEPEQEDVLIKLGFTAPPKCFTVSPRSKKRRPALRATA